MNPAYGAARYAYPKKNTFRGETPYHDQINSSLKNIGNWFADKFQNDSSHTSLADRDVTQDGLVKNKITYALHNGPINELVFYSAEDAKNLSKPKNLSEISLRLFLKKFDGDVPLYYDYHQLIDHSFKNWPSWQIEKIVHTICEINNLLENKNIKMNLPLKLAISTGEEVCHSGFYPLEDTIVCINNWGSWMEFELESKLLEIPIISRCVPKKETIFRPILHNMFHLIANISKRDELYQQIGFKCCQVDLPHFLSKNILWNPHNQFQVCRIVQLYDGDSVWAMPLEIFHSDCKDYFKRKWLVLIEDMEGNYRYKKKDSFGSPEYLDEIQEPNLSMFGVDEIHPEEILAASFAKWVLGEKIPNFIERIFVETFYTDLPYDIL